MKHQLKEENIPSAKSDLHKDLENEELTESDPEIKDFMQKYWRSIRSFTKKGKVQNIFNIFYDSDFKVFIETMTKRVKAHRKIFCNLTIVCPTYSKIFKLKN